MCFSPGLTSLGKSGIWGLESLGTSYLSTEQSQKGDSQENEGAKQWMLKIKYNFKLECSNCVHVK